MGLQDCGIILENPWNTYYAGETVKGKVQLFLTSPKVIRGIVIRFLGEANTNWTEKKQEHDREANRFVEVIENLSGHEEYFKNSFYLLGGINGSQITLPAGQHVFPFNCALPPSLPSSFEGRFGHIRYTIKVTLDRPWKYDQDTKMAFTVISPLDLNQNPRLKEPMRLDIEKSFCCFCCASGPLHADVAIPAGGYVPGQSIPIAVDVDNASDVKVERLRVFLNKTVTFKTIHPRRAVKGDQKTIAEISMGPVEVNSSKNWQQNFQIPPLPPSNLNNCGIIDLDYALKVELVVSGSHLNLKGKIPITIGTVPFNTIGWTPYSGGAQQHQRQPTAPIQDMPPPSYDESQYRAKIKDKDDSQYTRFVGDDFAPRYPVYTAQTLPPVPS